jgi:hypothetical protein
VWRTRVYIDGRQSIQGKRHWGVSCTPRKKGGTVESQLWHTTRETRPSIRHGRLVLADGYSVAADDVANLILTSIGIDHQHRTVLSGD